MGGYIVKHLSWDVDGTLYKMTFDMRALLPAELARKAAQQLNISIEEAQTKITELYTQFKSYTKSLDMLNLNGKLIVSTALETMDFTELIQQDAGIISMFQSLKEFSHSIVTDTLEKLAIKKLQKIGLESIVNFDPFLTRESTGGTKHSGEPYKKLLEALDAKRILPKTAVYIGDNENTDVIPARSFGFRTMYVGDGETSADIKIDSVYDVPEALGKLIKIEDNF